MAARASALATVFLVNWRLIDARRRRWNDPSRTTVVPEMLVVGSQSRSSKGVWRCLQSGHHPFEEESLMQALGECGEERLDRALGGGP